MAEGRERGSDAVRLFIRLAQPDAALDELADGPVQPFQEEFERAISRLRLRTLEEQAARLANLAAQDPMALGELQQVRETIRLLKAGTPPQ